MSSLAPGSTGRRDVVLVGSAAALTPMVGLGMYGASKRGPRAAFDTMRLEFAPLGINVGLVTPGVFDTEGLWLEDLVDGEVPDFGVPMFAADCGAAPAEHLGDVIVLVLGLPEGIGINELVVRPTGQLNP